ncbi:Hypothetical predicted protein [Pelobates cultripes]|uniref:Uncharacterized protein n=1 Tax=Pelobates cultripes TaxID=61616 RepID=A0AAD1WSP4_PELCU|nr:Hypothetical predicted protein [Pelobates cultripes]
MADTTCINNFSAIQLNVMNRLDITFTNFWHKLDQKLHQPTQTQVSDHSQTAAPVIQSSLKWQKSTRKPSLLLKVTQRQALKRSTAAPREEIAQLGKLQTLVFECTSTSSTELRCLQHSFLMRDCVLSLKGIG